VRNTKFIAILVVLSLLMGAGCQMLPPTQTQFLRIEGADYFDKVYGAWQATMLANHTGLLYEGQFLDEPSSDDTIQLALLDEWSTDDDTSIEWVDLYILETYGIDPTYEQIRDAWVLHLNNDIWNATRRARDLMDQGVLPPDTGSAELNPEGTWSISAQLQTELFGLIAPGMPAEAARRASYFGRVTNSGPAVEASAFYAALYALAFFEDDIPTLIRDAQRQIPDEAEINQIVDRVRAWHQHYPDDWRRTRQLIRTNYDHDPEWWASRVNFASTVMALLYGQGDLIETMTIACLAGWDADNNATTSAGLIGIILGYENLPEIVSSSTDVYFNPDVTGGLPTYDSVKNIAARTQAVGELVILEASGQVLEEMYLIPPGR
jgi:ADP-ribosylglycohydrolase